MWVWIPHSFLWAFHLTNDSVRTSRLSPQGPDSAPIRVNESRSVDFKGFGSGPYPVSSLGQGYIPG